MTHETNIKCVPPHPDRRRNSGDPACLQWWSPWLWLWSGYCPEDWDPEICFQGGKNWLCYINFSSSYSNPRHRSRRDSNPSACVVTKMPVFFDVVSVAPWTATAALCRSYVCRLWGVGWLCSEPDRYPNTSPGSSAPPQYIQASWKVILQQKSHSSWAQQWKPALMKTQASEVKSKSDKMYKMNMAKVYTSIQI